MTADNDDDDDNGNDDDDKNSGLSSCWSSPDGNSGGQDHSGTPPHIFQMMIMMMIRKIFFMVITIMWTIIPTQTIYLTQWTLMKMFEGFWLNQCSRLRPSWKLPVKVIICHNFIQFSAESAKTFTSLCHEQTPIAGQLLHPGWCHIGWQIFSWKEIFWNLLDPFLFFYRNNQNAQFFFLRSEWMIRRHVESVEPGKQVVIGWICAIVLSYVNWFVLCCAMCYAISDNVSRCVLSSCIKWLLCYDFISCIQLNICNF